MIVLTACKTIDRTTIADVYKDTIRLNSENNMKISVIKGQSFNYPTFVLWIEDMNGNYKYTIFITESYASGIYKYEMISINSINGAWYRLPLKNEHRTSNVQHRMKIDVPYISLHGAR